MSNIQLINPDNTSGAHKDVFDQINGAFGSIPNMFKAIGNSLPAVESMWTSFGALSKGKLGPKLGEQIAVYVAELNQCQYCLSAHTLLGINAGATEEEMKQAQAGKSSDPRTQAALDFAGKLVRGRAHLKSEDFAEVRRGGFGDEEIAELLAHVALNIFTNYTNVALDVPIDFPKISLLDPAA